MANTTPARVANADARTDATPLVWFDAPVALAELEAPVRDAEAPAAFLLAPAVADALAEDDVEFAEAVGSAAKRSVDWKVTQLELAGMRAV